VRVAHRQLGSALLRAARSQTLPNHGSRFDRTFWSMPGADVFHRDGNNIQQREVFMSTFVIVGKRLIPREHIAFVESYDAAASPQLQTTRDFRGCVMMVNRDSILIEEPVSEFASANGFRMLLIDRFATNSAVALRVETFVAANGFKPNRANATRLLWRDLEGNEQCKLLLSEPDTALAIAVRGEVEAATPPDAVLRRSNGKRRPRPVAAPAAIVRIARALTIRRIPFEFRGLFRARYETSDIKLTYPTKCIKLRPWFQPPERFRIKRSRCFGATEWCACPNLLRPVSPPPRFRAW
jgi:hypothetical protein